MRALTLFVFAVNLLITGPQAAAAAVIPNESCAVLKTKEVPVGEKMSAELRAQGLQRSEILGEAFNGIIVQFIAWFQKNVQISQELIVRKKQNIIGPVKSDESGKFDWISDVMQTLPPHILNHSDSTYIDKVINLFRFHRSIGNSIRGIPHLSSRLKKVEHSLINLPEQIRADGFNLSLMEMLLAPIGEYGIEYQKSIMLTASLLIEIILNGGKDHPFFSADNDLPENVDFSRKLMDSNAERKLYYDHQRTLIEGVLSIYQSILLLSSNKIGNLSSDEILNLLIFPNHGSNGAVAQLARYIPPAFLGPVLQNGFLFDKPMKIGPIGNLKPTKAFYDLLEVYRGLKIQMANEQARIRKEKAFRPEEKLLNTCRGCPVAPEGVQKLSELFYSFHLQIIGISAP